MGKGVFMAQSSIVNILTISFPEEIIITILGLLAIGKFELVRNKRNWHKILITALLLSVISFFVRKAISTEIENLLISFIFFTLLYIFVLRLTVYESIMASLLALIILAIIQTPCIMILSSIIRISLEDVAKSNLMFFLFFIPERIVELLLICLSLKYEIKIMDFEKKSYIKKDFYIQLFVYIVCLCTLIPLMILLARTVIYGGIDSIINTANSVLIRVNIYLTIFVTIILTISLKNTSDYYKKKNSLNNNEIKQSLEYISSLLNEKNYDELKDAVDKLSEHISKQ